MYNKNEINVTLTPYQVDYLQTLIETHLEAEKLPWGHDLVMLEGLIEQFAMMGDEIEAEEDRAYDLLKASYAKAESN